MVKQNLENCRIIINDMNGNFLADTRVLEYNSITNTIQVEGNAYDWRIYSRLKILIFCNSQLLEYKGTTRKFSISANIEIGMYQGRKKEDRKQSRYSLSSMGEVYGITIEDQSIFLHNPIPAMVKNISTTGILIMALDNCFQDDSVFQLNVPANEPEISVECQVVRKREVTEELAEYGCRFLKHLK